VSIAETNIGTVNPSSLWVSRLQELSQTLVKVEIINTPFKQVTIGDSWYFKVHRLSLDVLGIVLAADSSVKFKTSETRVRTKETKLLSDGFKYFVTNHLKTEYFRLCWHIYQAKAIRCFRAGEFSQ